MSKDTTCRAVTIFFARNGRQSQFGYSQMTRAYRQLLAAGVLLAYSLGGTSLGAGLFAVVAAWSGAHQVNVRTVGSGGIEIVLHHQAGNYTPLVQDHQGLLAQVLASLCAADDLGDHVLSQQLTNACAASERDSQPMAGNTKLRMPLMTLSAVPMLIFPWCVPQRAERVLNSELTPFFPAHDGGNLSGWPHASERVAALLI
jgi:hypothetical protein